MAGHLRGGAHSCCITNSAAAVPHTQTGEDGNPSNKAGVFSSFGGSLANAAAAMGIEDLAWAKVSWVGGGGWWGDFGATWGRPSWASCMQDCAHHGGCRASAPTQHAHLLPCSLQDAEPIIDTHLGEGSSAFRCAAAVPPEELRRAGRTEGSERIHI